MAIALLLALVALLAGCQVLESRYQRFCQALAQARHAGEIEAVLGPPRAEYRTHGDAHRDHSAAIYTEQDEKAGLVLRLYSLRRAGFHLGYQTLVVKVRPSDGAVLGAKIYQD